MYTQFGPQIYVMYADALIHVYMYMYVIVFYVECNCTSRSLYALVQCKRPRDISRTASESMC